MERSYVSNGAAVPELTSQQEAFVHFFCELEDVGLAYKKAGYKPDASNARKLAQRLSSHINQNLRERMALTNQLALKTLERIVGDPNTHARDAIAAANSLLDRGQIARSATMAVETKATEETLAPVRRWMNGKDVTLMGYNRCLHMPTKNDTPLHDPNSPDWDLTHSETYEYLLGKNYFN